MADEITLKEFIERIFAERKIKVRYLIGLLPIDAKIKKIIQVIFIVICILWLLSLVFGNFGIANYRI